ncbi:MAG: hypothetical protein V7K76_22870 [Nostoc sp.]|uniref:hypothetical protein n=1 Tax=Nostoc sp. TaxID=1180 RepID=UPI002FFBED60
MFIVRDILVEVSWWKHQEIYHWVAYQKGEKILDSQCCSGFERESDATKHAEQEVNYYLENQEEAEE